MAMKIAYFHYIHGEDTSLNHVRQFARAARALGHDIQVHAMNPGIPEQASGHTGGLKRSLKNRLSRYLHEPKALLMNAPYVKRELDILRATRPDVALVRSHTLTTAEAFVRVLSGIPLVLEINAPAYESTTYWTKYAHLPHAAHLSERIKLRRADRVTVVSAALREHLLTAHEIERGRFVVNHNGADCDEFRPDLDASAVRREHAITDAPLVGFVSSFHPWHGVDLLKAVIAELAPTGVRFMTIGSGQGTASFLDWLETSPHGKSVVALGSIDHSRIPVHVAAFDVALIAGANAYVSPLKMFEYMAAGRAIVAPAHDPILEVLDDGQDALLFPPGDTAAAADRLRNLLEDSALRSRLGCAARQKALSAYTWRHNAERAVAACEAAISSVQPSSRAISPGA